MKTEIKNLRILLEDHFEFCDIDHFLKQLLSEISNLIKVHKNFKNAKTEIDRTLFKAINSSENQNQKVIRSNAKAINKYAKQLKEDLNKAKSKEDIEAVLEKTEKVSKQIDEFDSVLEGDLNMFHDLIDSVKCNFELIDSNVITIRKHKWTIFRAKFITNSIQLLPIFILLIIGIFRTYIFKLIPKMEDEYFIFAISILILMFYFISKNINRLIKYNIIKPVIVKAIKQIEESENKFILNSNKILTEYNRILNKMKGRYRILEEINMHDIVRRYANLVSEYGS